MDQNKKDILKRFKDSGPGFEIPKGYFKKLEHELKNEVDKEKSMLRVQKLKENRANKEFFSSTDKPKTGFTVPDGYFNELESNLSVENEKKLFRLTHRLSRYLRNDHLRGSIKRDRPGILSLDYKILGERFFLS